MENENKLKNIGFFDTHAHLNFDPIKRNIDAMIERAQSEGVTRIVTIGAGEGLAGNKSSLEIAESNNNVWATLGVHPHDAKLADEASLRGLAAMLPNPKIVAWGEIGLDFHYDHSPRDIQRKVFNDQLKIASDVGLPVVIHDREAHEETMGTLRKFYPASGRSSRLSGIMHCFSGDAAIAKESIKLGFLISIPGVVTFNNAKMLVDVVREIPIEKIVIETDCPFLTPAPHRGKKNEPAFVRYVAEKIAQIKGLSLDDVARVTTSNALEVFGIESPARRAEIVYTIRGNLYLNITNRCNNKCSFCPKHSTGTVKAHYLLLDSEPGVEEVMSQIGDPTRYPEVVFVGLGEPTLRLDTIVEIAKRLKSKGARVRIDTDGQANLVYGRDVTSELIGLIDSISVSMNAADAETYARICRPEKGKAAYHAILDFLRAAKKNIPEVTATVVGMPGIDVEACRKIAEDIGVKFRVRVYDDPGAP